MPLGASRTLTAAGASRRALVPFCTVTPSTGCSSPAAASAKLEPSRAEAAVPAGSIMLPPSGLQTLLGDSCLINADFAPFRRAPLVCRQLLV